MCSALIQTSITRMRREAGSRWRVVAHAIIHACFGAMATMLLVAVGRPLYTDDTWWHLALGRVYAEVGPWLLSDPVVHTATAPPLPAAWLFDLALFRLQEVFGFGGLRLLHVGAVLATLALAWWWLWRASESKAVASLASCAFIALASYRLFQLRPELVTILATLALYGILFAHRDAPSGFRMGIAVGLCALWANLHAAFLLGPILVAVAAISVAISIPFVAEAQRSRSVARAVRLGATAALAVAATWLNPAGAAAQLAFFRAGGETPALTTVVDEWASVHLFELPVANLPPSLLAWLLVWILLGSTPLAALFLLRGRNPRAEHRREVDPVWVGLALASLAGMILAVRFLWMGIFPLLLLARVARASPPVRPGRRLLAFAATSLAILPGFAWFGDWPFLKRGLPTQYVEYFEPFDGRKYYAHAAWFLRDAGLSGNLYNAYFAGGFLGYWLSPTLRVFANGSLNLPDEAMKAYEAIQRGGGEEPSQHLTALLDRYQVDLFVGMGLPGSPRANRPRRYTTSHLEREPGWILVFRNLNSSVYLRANERNAENLSRIADYYVRAGVPFDPTRGFEPARVLTDAPTWAWHRGLVSPALPALLRVSVGDAVTMDARALERLAASYAALGLYEQAIDLDRRTLAWHPTHTPARRRLVWSLLRLDRAEEARRQADLLIAAAPPKISSLGTSLTSRASTRRPRARRVVRPSSRLYRSSPRRKWAGSRGTSSTRSCAPTDREGRRELASLAADASRPRAATHCMWWPQFAFRACPVMPRARSEARKRTASATSSGRAIRRNGSWSATERYTASGEMP